MPSTHAKQKPRKVSLNRIPTFTQFDLNARGSQRGDPSPGNLWVGIFQRDHHPTHAGAYQGASTGSCLTLMTAGLERDVGGCTACLTGMIEGHDFGVRLPRRLGKTSADLGVIAHQHAAYGGVGG
jgi:hypothetical protein